MNPFVNPQKRGFMLPAGCKNLADVLQRPKHKGYDPIRGFIFLILMQAQQEHANEVVIGVAPEGGGETSMRYKVGDTWREFPFPYEIRSLVLSELARMAALPEGSFPKDGTFSLGLETTRLKWRVQMIGPDSECTLTHLED